MQKPPPQPPEYGENIAGRLFEVARQLQKNRESYAGVRRPTPLAQKVSEGQEVMDALTKKKQDEQGQSTSSAPGTPQEKRGQEQGRK
jgi:hypothetical protein